MESNETLVIDKSCRDAVMTAKIAELRMDFLSADAS